MSSVWTLFGSVSVYPELEEESEPRRWREPSTSSLDFQFGEEAEIGHLGAYTPGPSPCPSPGLGEAQPLARGASLSSVRSVHDGLSLSHSHLNVPPLSTFKTSPSSELFALSGADYILANPSNRSDRGF